jgi:PAS domain S-box-containing protein
MVKSFLLTRLKRQTLFALLFSFAILILPNAAAPQATEGITQPKAVSAAVGRFTPGSLVVLSLCIAEGLLILLLLLNRKKHSLRTAEPRPIDSTRHNSPELLASLVDSAMDAIIVVDSDRRVVLFNAAASRVFDCPASEAIGSPIERFIPQRFRIAFRTHIPNFVERGDAKSAPVAALWGLRANGEEFPIETATGEVKSDDQKLTTLTVRDITEHLRAEQALRESEERFRLVTSTAPMLVWMSGTDKLCTYFNKAWLSFTGRSMDSELGNGWVQGVHPEDAQKCMDIYARAFDRREEFRMEYRLRRYDGEYRWIVDVGVPRFHPDGSFTGYIGSCIDITERKRVEGDRLKMLEEIAHLNRVASMGQMAASLAHELAQPLAAILSNAQAAVRFASRPQPDLVEIQGALADITEDDERARSFVQNMRSMFQRQTIRRTRLDLNRISYEVSRLVRNDAVRRGVHIELNSSPDPIFVFGDAIVLQQVILNLVNNGMDALENMPAGHKVLKLTTLIHPGSEFGTILVEDNGCGIAEEDKPKLFTPFFTTKKDGLGMGLSICRSLIESLDGRIALLDRVEGGAVFKVDLPLIARDKIGEKPNPQLLESMSAPSLETSEMNYNMATSHLTSSLNIDDSQASLASLER